METTANKGVYNKRIIIKISTKDFLISILCFVISKVQLMLYMNPFGMAFYGATFTPSGWYFSLIAFIAATVFSKGNFTSFRYILAAGLVTPVIAFSNNHKPVFRATVVSVGYLLVSTLLMLTGKFLFYDYIIVVFESFICFIFCCLLNNSANILIDYTKKECFTYEESISVITILFLLFLRVAVLPEIFGLRMGTVVLVFVLMCLGNNSNITVASVGGITTGLAVCIAQQQSMAVVGAYAFCSLVSSMFKKYGRLGAFFGFTFANTVITAFFNNEFYLLISPMEVFVSGVVFSTMPKKVINQFDVFFDKLTHKPNTVGNKSKYQYDRIEDISESLSQLSQLYSKDITQKVLGKQYIHNLFNMCVERVCSNCGLKMSCWKTSTYRNYEYMTKMFEYAGKKGMLDNTGLPGEFVKRCVKKDEFVRGFNFCYDLYKTDKIWLGKIFAIKNLMASQLMAVSDSLAVSGQRQFDVNYKLSSAFCQQNKSGEKVCGDSLCEVELPCGNYAVVLADGMGSGYDANSHSSDAAKMFALLVNIGMDAEKAVQLINLSMCIKSERECFSAMDIIYVDFENNSLSLLKAGTSPTYVISSGIIRKYECNTLPVGILKDIQIQNYTIPLSSDMIVLVTSDGICNTILQDETGVDWIKIMLEEQTTSEPEELTEMVLKEAIAHNNGLIPDDMTAYVLKVKE